MHQVNLLRLVVAVVVAAYQASLLALALQSPQSVAQAL
jgi:hypothetical protein